MLGSAVLFVGSSLPTTVVAKNLYSLNDESYQFLRPLDVEFLLALAPAVLKSNYPGKLGKKAQLRLISAIDKQIASLAEHSKNQLRQLFDLLTTSALRYLAGVPTSKWSVASVEQADGFLISWKSSMFSLKRTGYTALVKLITMSWYCQAENYQQAGYPGPPKIYLPQE